MKWQIWLLLMTTLLVANGVEAQNKERVLDITASDGVKLKASYYSPGKPGPGILLLHQCNMDRKSWTNLAEALSKKGFHVLTFDYRGYGESPKASGSYSLPGDIDAAFAVLTSMPGVDKNHLAAGGASCGVNNAVQLARSSGQIKALILLSGPTTREGLKFLKDHPNIAIFGAASSEEGPAVTSIRAMVETSTYSSSTVRVLNNAGHGVPMFDKDTTLMPTIADWLAKVLGK